MRGLAVLATTALVGTIAGTNVHAAELAETASSTTSSAAAGRSIGFVRPRPLVEAVVPSPSDAPVLLEDVSVTVRLRIEVTGEVSRSELLRSAGEPWDRAVLEGSTRFVFAPATYYGAPVPVDLTFTQRFTAPPRGATEEVSGHATALAPPNARLAGIVRERGSRRPIAGAELSAEVDGRVFLGEAGIDGRFELPLLSGTATVSIQAPGYRPFLQVEHLGPNERLEVVYLVELETYNPYEVVVLGRQEKREVSRTTLSGRDIRQVPGTFGDPFRVIGALPGVSSVVSLLPFPVVRGSSPGNTGFLLDGVRVPLLFHLLAGPSVIHPEFIDTIEFSPGGFPAEYGGYTGGVVDGKTRAARIDEHRIDADLNFFQLGGLVREPIALLGATGTVAGRYGFPGLVLSLASPTTTLDYWDYQARLDGGNDGSGWTLFVLGANDALDAVPAGQPATAAKEPLLHFQFHRVDLRYHRRSDGIAAEYQLTLGYDGSVSRDAVLDAFDATPRVRVGWAVSPGLDLRFGLDGTAKHADLVAGANGTGALGKLVGSDGEPSNLLFSGGLLSEAIWSPYDGLLVRPGVRLDTYYDTKTSHVSIDPRLLARHRVASGSPDVWLKGSVGIYHQPPRFTIPVPGLDELAFQKGLLAATQSMIGADVVFGAEWSLDVQTYFNWMDPILFDTQLQPSPEDVQKLGPTAPPGVEPETLPKNPNAIQSRLEDLLVAATGRSYGLEVLLRRRSETGVSGWLAYTLSRSERLRDGQWVAFDFDRTHIVNVVVGIPLPRRWQLGLRAQVQTGRPLTTTTGFAEARTDPFVRFDLRVDKTAVWNDWLLDFYVDVSNVVLGAEELAPGNNLRYVLPTAGLRALF